MPAQPAAVVLAGGASRRMGRDKANLPFHGATLVEHVVWAVQQRCGPVFVVGAPGQPLPHLDAVLLRDDIGGLGPLVASGRGLRAASEAGAQWAFVCAVDMPFLDAGLIDLLISSSNRPDVDVVLPWDGRDHYLAGLYRTALVARIDMLVAAGKRSMAALVHSVAVQRIVLEADSRQLVNVNVVDDLPILG